MVLAGFSGGMWGNLEVLRKILPGRIDPLGNICWVVRK